jgi:hypothetical protein
MACASKQVFPNSARAAVIWTRPLPYKAGTEVHVLIRYRGRCCELLGRVIYAHKGWGMGVLFGNVPGQHFDILDSWLVQLEHEGAGIKPNRMAA